MTIFFMLFFFQFFCFFIDVFFIVIKIFVHVSNTIPDILGNIPFGNDDA